MASLLMSHSFPAYFKSQPSEQTEIELAECHPQSHGVPLLLAYDQPLIVSQTS